MHWKHFFQIKNSYRLKKNNDFNFKIVKKTYSIKTQMIDNSSRGIDHEQTNIRTNGQMDKWTNTQIVKPTNRPTLAFVLKKLIVLKGKNSKRAVSKWFSFFFLLQPFLLTSFFLSATHKFTFSFLSIANLCLSYFWRYAFNITTMSFWVLIFAFYHISILLEYWWNWIKCITLLVVLLI